MRHLSLYVESELHKSVEKAAAAVGMKIAPWLRHMVGQVTIEDFPRSWQEERSPERSHDPRSYGKRVMLRLDDLSPTTLQPLIEPFGVIAAPAESHADILRAYLVLTT